MRYLNAADIEIIGIDWMEVLSVIDRCTSIFKAQDFSQPVKPYLRYNDLKNRIIAMPAYVGGEFGTAGIKWIASFPGNKMRAMPRAHSVLILSDADTGKPLSVLNTAILSGVRTAAVSGLVMRRYLSKTSDRGRVLNVGIVGLGQIGQLHLAMILCVFGELVNNVFVYDISPDAAEKIPSDLKQRVTICKGWEEVFYQSDVFITCTVADRRYIDKTPPKPSLHLNVSLRDYHPGFLKHVDLMLVDNWKEVCRENTDIEMMHREYGLEEKDVSTMVEFMSPEQSGIGEGQVVMFNPMGMAVYDIAVGKYFYDLALRQNVGTELDD